MVRVTVTWKQKPFEVAVDTEQPPVVLKMQLFSLMGVPPERQKVMLPKGGLLKDDTDWGRVGLKEGAKLMLLGTAEKLPEAPTTAPKFLEDLPEDEQDTTGLAKYGAGLQNLGNTCYMNSTLQCLYRVPELRTALDSYEDQGSRLSLPHDLVTAARGLFKELERSAKPVLPYAFLTRLRSVYPQFAEQNRQGAFKQQDAEECWAQLMHALGTQLQRPGAGKEDAIKRLFGVELHTEFKAKETGEVAKEAPAWAYALKCNITSEVNNLVEGLKLGLKADREAKGEGGRDLLFEGTSQIATLPPYLTVQLVRFFYKVDVQQKAKIMRKVDFPQVLDVYPFCAPALQEQLKVARRVLDEAEEAKDAAERAARDAKRAQQEAEEAASKPGMKKATKKSQSATPATSAAAKPPGESGVPPASASAAAADKAPEEAAPAGGSAAAPAAGADAQPAAAPGGATPSTAKADTEMVDAGAAGPSGDQAAQPRTPGHTGRFQLVAVLTHKGRSADSGHYVSWVKQDDGSWIQFDDEELIPRKESEISSLAGGGDWHMAYMLLYRAILA